MEAGVLRRVLHAWALDAAAFADVLARHDPTWGSQTHPMAGGQLVLSGCGLYVNRAMAAGIAPALTESDVDQLVAESLVVGVPPAIEVSPVTATETLRVLASHNFERQPDSDVTALVWPVGERPLPDSPMDVVIRSISAASIKDWQEVSALGWGHTSAEARRASDAFVAAAHAIDGDGMVIAHDAGDGRPLGCASLTRRTGVATLGGMSTIPAERRRGVQAALVRHRIEVAIESGCDLIVSGTASGGASQRNLQRLGFVPGATISTWADRPSESRP
jgi:GNAT superfamily N-acetyltransferase